MMMVVLTLFLILHGGAPVALEWAVLADAQACDLTGRAMALMLQDTTPGLVVGWRCDPSGVAA